MKLRWLAMLACLLIVACGKSESAKNPPAVTKSPTVTKSPMERFTEISESYDSAVKEFRTVVREAPPEDRQELYEKSNPKAADYSDKLFEIAQENPDDDAAFDSLKWIITHDRSSELAESSYKLLLSKYIDNEDLQQICLSLSYFSDPGPVVEDRLKHLIENSPHDTVKGAATFALAGYLQRLPETQEYIAKNPDYAERYSEESRDYINAYEAQPTVIETLYETVIEKYPDGKRHEKAKQTYGMLAESALFELRHLSIGKVAPDIEGEDLDGKSFKLSDYRGKVVVLDFWGDW